MENHVNNYEFDFDNVNRKHFIHNFQTYSQH